MMLEQQAKTFGDWAEIAIAKHFRKILKHEAGVLRGEDPEELHQMRVGMRRLRSAIAGFAQAVKLPKPARDKNLGKVGRTLGTLRDLDVLEGVMKKQYQPTLPKAEQKHLNQALKVLENKRSRTFKEVEILLHSQPYQDLKKAFQQWLDHPSYQELAALSMDAILPDLLLPQVSQLLLHPGWLVGVTIEAGEVHFPDGLSQEEVERLLQHRGKILHDLRKEAKRSRYQLELFPQFYGDTYADYIRQIKKIQEVLGQIQDCFVLVEFLTGVFESNLQSEVPTLSAQLTATRYQRWQEWELLQRQFLNSQTRQDLRLTVQHPLSEIIPIC